MIASAKHLAESHGMAAACRTLGLSRSSLYRADAPTAVAVAPAEPSPRPAPPRTLSQAEHDQVRELLNSERFQDKAPREVYAELLDEEQYLCSWRTMYRILAEHDEVRERRNQLRHSAYTKPELLATGPNEVWTWDISKLRGPSKGVYYYLYVIIDIFSRYVVGWMIAEVESAELAEQLIAAACSRQGVQQAQLTIHADNGSPMIAKSVAILLADLGVAKSHSRPHVSNDNPYSEAQFKTLKYRPDYPERFASLVDARHWGRAFFHWYNHEHHHTGLGLLTPADVHAGRAATVRQQRQTVLQQAFEAHPERFVKGAPQPDKLPEAAWINPPKPGADSFAAPPGLSYTAPGGTEDRATLRSDPSADPADGVAGQSCDNAALPTITANQPLHCQESDKPKPTRQRALVKSATTDSADLAKPSSAHIRTLNSS